MVFVCFVVLYHKTVNLRMLITKKIPILFRYASLDTGIYYMIDSLNPVTGMVSWSFNSETCIKRTLNFVVSQDRWYFGTGRKTWLCKDVPNNGTYVFLVRLSHSSYTVPLYIEIYTIWYTIKYFSKNWQLRFYLMWIRLWLDRDYIRLVPWKAEYPILTLRVQVTPYGERDQGQYWLMQWFVIWRHQAITWSNADLSSVRCGDTHPISLVIPQPPSSTTTYLKISLKSPRGQWVKKHAILHRHKT